jgi:hypothetical protein
MRPHLVRWHEKYGSKGLAILDVHDGRIDRDRDGLWKSLKKEKVPFAVAHDAEGRSTVKYGIRAFPSAYLIGRDGRVLWEGFPLPEVESLEKRIEEALAEAAPSEAVAKKGGEGPG